MKKSLVILISLGLIVLLSMSVVSASWFGDFWKKITGRTTENDTSSGCADECSTNGNKQCSSSLTGYQTCGNYDSDSCLEWGSVTSCSSSETCVAGACVSNTFTCTDTDGGKDYNTQGNVVASSPTSSTDVTDLCSSSSSLVEYFCTNLQQSGETYTCPNGCSNGACISSTTTNQTGNTTSNSATTSTTTPVSVTNPAISIAPTTTASAGAGSAGRTTSTKLEISEGVFEENTIEEKTEGETIIKTEAKKITDTSGNKVNVEIKTEIRKDGTTLIEEEREFFTKSGILIKLKSIIENDGVNIKIRREIEIGGEKIESGVEMIEKFEGEEVKLKAKLSNGNEQEIKIMPDRASEIAIEKLRTKNFDIELKEVGEGENLKAVYIAKVDKTGKLLGLFKVRLKSEAQINGETGELLSLEKPWWNFLVSNLNPPKELLGNQTCTDDCSPNGATVCWGMGGYQTCGNYDADSCLELSSAVTSCPNTLGCINGSCVTLNNQTGNLTNITLPPSNNITINNTNNLTNITLPPPIPINWSINYTCKDSDGGKNYSMKGNVVAKSPASDINVTDLCSSPSVLVEYFCTNLQQSGETHNCPNGCSNGACI